MNRQPEETFDSPCENQYDVYMNDGLSLALPSSSSSSASQILEVHVDHQVQIPPVSKGNSSSKSTLKTRTETPSTVSSLDDFVTHEVPHKKQRFNFQSMWAEQSQIKRERIRSEEALAEMKIQKDNEYKASQQALDRKAAFIEKMILHGKSPQEIKELLVFFENNLN